MLRLLRAFIAAQCCLKPPHSLLHSCAPAGLRSLPRPLQAAVMSTSSSSVGSGHEDSARRAPIKIELRDEDVIESFVKGSGPGGQKINKARNCVQLTHIPTGIMAKSQEFRDLTSNRKAARKILLAKLDEHFNGDLSKKAQKIAKIRKTKARYERRRRQQATEAEDGADITEAGDSGVETTAEAPER